jgi:alpha-amylase
MKVALLFGSIYSTYVGVTLFQWKFTDIGSECIDFLGPNGYSYVQVSPVQQSVKGPDRGWWDSYQPIGYKIGNKLGTEGEFIDMVLNCKNAGVDVVVDVVLNHFTDEVNIQESECVSTGCCWDALPGYPYCYYPENSVCPIIPTIGDLRDDCYSFSIFSEYTYNSDNGFISKYLSQYYPEVGFNHTHFNDDICNHDISRYNDDWEIYNCRLANLSDLKTDDPYVRYKQIEFLNKLMEYDVTGLRIDAAKHIPLSDLSYLFKNINKNYKGESAFISLEVLFAFDSDNTYKNYETVGDILNFDYGKLVGSAFRSDHGKSTDKLAEILNSLQITSDNSISIVENHDTERGNTKHFALSILNGGWWYKQAIAFNILYPWGTPNVHSGYFIDNTNHHGSPVHPVIDSDGYILPVGPIIDNMCGNGWMCQHRWADVYPLVSMRNYIQGKNLPEIKTMGVNSNQIYWSVVNKGFVAINSAQGSQTLQNMNNVVQSGLPAGVYCNMVYARAVSGHCELFPGIILTNNEQVTYTIDDFGLVKLNINHNSKSRVIALKSDTDGYISRPISTLALFNVKYDTGYGTDLYIVGDFQGWDVCNAIPCEWNTGNIWTCNRVLTTGVTYEWKPIYYSSIDSCKNVKWYSGNNYVHKATGIYDTINV